MYQADNTKRYNVSVYHPNQCYARATYTDVKLLSASANFVVIQEANGKEHIITGGACCIYIDEV